MNYSQIHTFLKRSIFVLSLLIGVKSFAFIDTGAGLLESVNRNTIITVGTYSCSSVFTGSSNSYVSTASCPYSFGSKEYVIGTVTTETIYSESSCDSNIQKSVTKTFTDDLECISECNIEIVDSWVFHGSYENCEDKILELGHTSASAKCACSETATEPFSFHLYYDPAVITCPNSNESNVDNICTCNDGYTRDASGNCSSCYDLVFTPSYYEQTYNVSESECVLKDEDKVSLAGKYVSNLHFVSCLPSCIVGITVCSQGDKVNDTKDGCISDEAPNPDETCGGWVRVDFIDNRGETTDYYNGETLPDHCYNVYECQTDSSLIKYTDVSCGEEDSDDDNNTSNSSDPHEAENEFDDLNSTSTSFDNNVSTPMLDMNGTSSGDVAIIAKLSKINDTLFQMDETLQQGFADISDEVNTLGKVNEEGFSTLETKIGETNSKLDETNSKLDDVNINLEGIESKLDSIDSKLTDSRTQGDYDNFVTNEIQNSFNTFADKGVLPFSGVVSAVPNVAFSMHGETFSLLSPEMLASVDWSIFRGFLLFLAAISGFHRVFTNV